MFFNHTNCSILYLLNFLELLFPIQTSLHSRRLNWIRLQILQISTLALTQVNSLTTPASSPASWMIHDHMTRPKYSPLSESWPL